MAIPRGITADDVRRAVRDFDAGVDHPFGESTGYDLVIEGRRYPPKAIVGLAARRLLGGEILSPEAFSGGEGPSAANRVLRDLGFTVVPKGASVPTERPRVRAGVRSPADAEVVRRSRLWERLLEAGGPCGVAPALLRELHIYVGYSSIFVDKERTGSLTPDGSGVTVSLLHTGRYHAEDLGSERLLFHYPTTRRAGRDEAEVAATRNAALLRVPILVITHNTDERLRDVTRARVDGWNDTLGIFDLAFIDPAPSAATTSAAGGSVPTGPVGAPYRSADESSGAAPRDPFTIDPDVIDRGLRGHAATQNALAAWLSERGLVPLSPTGSPNYDLAWEDGPVLYVAEVKSLTATNETQQLRLGLGQVLDYRAMLAGRGEVVPVLAVEREPSDRRWVRLCRDTGVVLTWPPAFTALASRAN